MCKYIPMRKPFWIIMFATLLMGAADPGGCVQMSPAGLHAVCSALVGPIVYNTYNRTSGRYAGPILGMDLKQRNQIGQRLGCVAYRVR
jgi:hypothetical protein